MILAFTKSLSSLFGAIKDKAKAEEKNVKVAEGLFLPTNSVAFFDAKEDLQTKLEEVLHVLFFIKFLRLTRNLSLLKYESGLF